MQGGEGMTSSSGEDEDMALGVVSSSSVPLLSPLFLQAEALNAVVKTTCPEGSRAMRALQRSLCMATAVA